MVEVLEVDDPVALVAGLAVLALVVVEFPFGEDAVAALPLRDVGEAAAAELRQVPRLLRLSVLARPWDILRGERSELD